jgi:hypothetical protein
LLPIRCTALFELLVFSGLSKLPLSLSLPRLSVFPSFGSLLYQGYRHCHGFCLSPSARSFAFQTPFQNAFTFSDSLLMDHWPFIVCPNRFLPLYFFFCVLYQSFQPVLVLVTSLLLPVLFQNAFVLNTFAFCLYVLSPHFLPLPCPCSSPGSNTEFSRRAVGKSMSRSPLG